MLTLCTSLHTLGYRRPGFLTYTDLNLRSNYQFSAAYLAASRFMFDSLAVPLFLGDDLPAKKLPSWIRLHRPDALIHEQQYFRWEWPSTVITRSRLSMPRDIGL